VSDGRDRLAVYLDATELGPLMRVGTLSRERSASRSVISFAYERDWVASLGSFALDPSLPLYEGEQYQMALPGIFADAAPDRWGRTLLERREALLARREQRRPRRLDDWDFLVGVNDATRMGALRLARLDGAFVDDAPLTVPPSAQLRELEHWARELEDGLPRGATDEDRWIAMLIAPGSSLGGARPKANFVGDDQALWIAKFPSRDDRRDVGAWEHVATRLAGDAGVEVAETRLLRLGQTHRTFASRRFDRIGNRRRLFGSAMTLVSRHDGDDASYLDIAQAIERSVAPAHIERDLKQLFRRVVFNVLVANRDDHLRNHGFLRSREGWRLAPAYDINPASERFEHVLALDGAVRVPDLALVRETAPLYRLSRRDADQVVSEVVRAVARWRRPARDAGIPAEQIELCGDAFELAGDQV
jgi:serine/threonine-protein kinase HipA